MQPPLEKIASDSTAEKARTEIPEKKLLIPDSANRFAPTVVWKWKAAETLL